jgi:hypothetical protein
MHNIVLCAKANVVIVPWSLYHEPQASLVISELLPHVEDVLFAGHGGVAVKMAEASLRNPAQQPEILKTLLAAFHAEDNPNSCVPLFLTLTAYEVYVEHKEKRERDKDIARVRPYYLQLYHWCAYLSCRGVSMCKAHYWFKRW